MSLLNKTPFLNSELAKLDAEELATLRTRIDGSSSFAYKSLVDANHLLSADDKLKAVALQVSNKEGIITGWFLGSSFIQYFPNRSEMNIWSVNLSTKQAKLVNEPFTATDLRQELDDAENPPLTYATDAEIDALFEDAEA